MRWIGALLLPLLGGGACFIMVMLASTTAATSGAAWARPLVTSRLLDTHLDFMPALYVALAVHAGWVILMALRSAATEEPKATHVLLCVPIAAVLAVPVVVWGFGVPVNELRTEGPIGLALVGL